VRLRTKAYPRDNHGAEGYRPPVIATGGPFDPNGITAV
jgi:hypothetical protein